MWCGRINGKEQIGRDAGQSPGKGCRGDHEISREDVELFGEVSCLGNMVIETSVGVGSGSEGKKKVKQKKNWVLRLERASGCGCVRVWVRALVSERKCV